MIRPRSLSRAAVSAVRSRFSRDDEERERTAAALARPTVADRARAEAEMGRAAGMSEEELAEAVRLIDRDFVRKLIRVASRLNPEVSARLLTGYLALRDPRVPFAAKAGLAAVLLYFVNPFDVVPDAVPLMGLLDDVGLLSVAWGYLGRNIRDEHRAEAEAVLRGEDDLARA